MTPVRKRNVCSVIVASITFMVSSFLMGAQRSDLLQYSLRAKPGNLMVDRMPTVGPNPKTYHEEFLLNVTNPRRSDFKGSTPTSQTFDIEVFSVGIDRETSVWKWSSGQHFSNIPRTIVIPAGKSWTPNKKIVWTFSAGDIKDGKYHVVATFVSTGSKQAIANFTITSVQ